MGRDLAEEVRDVVAGPVAGLGADLEDVEVVAAGRRRVVRLLVDTESGVSLDEVAEINRAAGTALDGSDVLGEQPYVLEVSSPGVGRPLTQVRHWRRNVGRVVRVKRVDGGEQVEGRILSVGDDAAVLAVAGAEVRLPYDSVDRAVVQVELNRSGGQ
jgi:ribosome maturation factor RimP